MRINIKENKDLLFWILFAVVGTAVLFVLAWFWLANLIAKYTWLSILITEIGIGSSLVYLWTGKERLKYYWLFIIIANICSGLYSLSLGYTITFLTYYLYYMPIELAGYGFWKKHMQNSDRVQTKTLEKKVSIILYALLTFEVLQFGILLYFISQAGFIYQDRSGFELYWYCFLDSARNIIGIVAMFLTLKRYSQSWELWLIVAFLSFIMYINAFFTLSNPTWVDYTLNSEWTVYSIYKMTMNVLASKKWKEFAIKNKPNLQEMQITTS